MELIMKNGCVDSLDSKNWTFTKIDPKGQATIGKKIVEWIGIKDKERFAIFPRSKNEDGKPVIYAIISGGDLFEHNLTKVFAESSGKSLRELATETNYLTIDKNGQFAVPKEVREKLGICVPQDRETYEWAVIIPIERKEAGISVRYAVFARFLDIVDPLKLESIYKVKPALI